MLHQDVLSVELFVSYEVKTLRSQGAEGREREIVRREEEKRREEKRREEKGKKEIL